MKKWLSILLIAIALTSLVYATGQKEDGAEDKEFLIGATGLHLDQFTNVLMNGYRTKAKELGIKIMISNSELSLDKEAETINNYIEAGVDALIIEPVSPTASVTIAEMAIARGIPVFACAIPIHSDKIFASSVNENTELGASTGKAAVSWLDAKYGKSKTINCALLAFDASAPALSEARIAGFQQEVKDFNINYVARQDALGGKAFQVTTDILTQNPDLNIIFSNSEVGLVGAHNAIVASGRVGEVFVFGVDASAQLVDMMIAEDIIQIATAQAPFEQGQYAVQTMYDYLVNGIEPKVKHFEIASILVQRSDMKGLEEFKANWLERSK